MDRILLKIFFCQDENVNSLQYLRSSDLASVNHLTLVQTRPMQYFFPFQIHAPAEQFAQVIFESAAEPLGRRLGLGVHWMAVGDGGWACYKDKVSEAAIG